METHFAQFLGKGSVSSRTEFKQGGWALTLLSLNVIMGYYIGYEEGMICFTGLHVH